MPQPRKHLILKMEQVTRQAVRSRFRLLLSPWWQNHVKNAGYVMFLRHRWPVGSAGFLDRLSAARRLNGFTLHEICIIHSTGQCKANLCKQPGRSTCCWDADVPDTACPLPTLNTWRWSPSNTNADRDLEGVKEHPGHLHNSLVSRQNISRQALHVQAHPDAER